MSTRSSIIERASEYVMSLFREKLPETLVYHSPSHTGEVVAAVEEIGIGVGLGPDDMEIAAVAAWMHDLGYVRTYQNHEEVGAGMAREFLRAEGYPEEKIAAVERCILATRYPQNPNSVLESVVCDADLSHVGRKDFWETADRLRQEWAVHLDRTYTDSEWLVSNLQFLDSHSFHTEFARRRFGPRKEANRAKIEKRMRKLERVGAPVHRNDGSEAHPAAVEEKKSKEGKTAKQERALEKGAVAIAREVRSILREERLVAKQHKEEEKHEKESRKEAEAEQKEKRPDRGVETMFRVTSRNHMDLSRMADDKANTLIQINTLIISIVLSVLASKLDVNQYLVVPTLVLLATAVLTIIFATLATRPKISSGRFTSEDVRQKKVNLLFFGNFFNMSLDDYDAGMKEMMNDREYLYGSMTRDIYFLGQVLGRKYRLLRQGYTIFMYGIIISVLAFVISFIYNMLTVNAVSAPT